MTSERIALILATLTIFTICVKEGVAERALTQAASTESIDRVVPTVPATEPQRIDQCPLFTRVWQSTQGSPAKPGDYPVGDIVSRVPSRALFVLPSGRGNVLRILDPKTGAETAQATLPDAVSKTHRRLDGEPGTWDDFSYSICHDAGNPLLLVKATQTKRRGTTSGSGIGTAVYGCTMDGTVLWSFLGKLTHNVCVVPVHGQSDLVVVEQGSDQIVLLSAAGHEIVRLLTPSFNHVEISKEAASETIRLILLADKIYCFAFDLNTLVRHNTHPSFDVLKAAPEE